MKIIVHVYDALSGESVVDYIFDWLNKNQRRVFSEQAASALRAGQVVITVREEYRT
jgi:hypothetical protein